MWTVKQLAVASETILDKGVIKRRRHWIFGVDQQIGCGFLWQVRARVRR